MLQVIFRVSVFVVWLFQFKGNYILEGRATWRDLGTFFSEQEVVRKGHWLSELIKIFL